MTTSTAAAAASSRAEPAVPRGGIGTGALVAILVQLGLVGLVLRQFQIESAAFRRLSLLVFGGFALHALLPVRYRLPFFLVLSLAGIGLVLGPENAVWLVIIGMGLIGICHLPIAYFLRVGMLVAAGAILAAQRASWVGTPWSEAIWPILGSMFMFRLIVYMYDLRHETEPASLWRSLSYFFMLPNVSFPLFPVIDYKAFRRNYFDQDAFETYQIGVDWIARGVLHLLFYRLIYYHFTLAPSEVRNVGDLLQYLISNFLLYLRVSGQFHLVVGMLYLFGFRLPETHHLYLLASSFTDFWRRINIYWKDFMLKIFYYPAYFVLRRLGTTWALVLATLFVFTMTWFLHAYQWFWLRGTGLLAPQDVLFWMILGVLVVVNALHESRHGRDRTLGKRPSTWRSRLVLSAKTLATFSVICVLWSFWTAQSVSEWLSLWTGLGVGFSTKAAVAALVLLGVIVVPMIAGPTMATVKKPGDRRNPWRASLATAALLVVIAGMGMDPVSSRFGATVETTVQSLRAAHLSRLDNANLERGYYENLLNVDRFNSQLWEVYMKRPNKLLDFESGPLKQYTGGFEQYELKPSFVYSNNGLTITINRWGMRDKDYERVPPPGTYRMAMLGPSSLMGWGVSDGETFEALLEDRLNREQPTGSQRNYEILNFGVPGYDPPQELVMFEKALGFAPNAVIYVAAGRELSRATRYVADAAREGRPIPYDFLREAAEKAGVERGMDETTAEKRLAPYRKQILSGIYGKLAADSRQRGIVPIYVFLPQVREGTWQEETPETLQIADAAGFVVIDLSRVYEGQELASIRVSEYDDHPNRLGHQLVAERLYQAFKADAEAIFPNDPSSAAQRPK